MKALRAWITSLLLCAALSPLQAAAQNLITNGSFEGGSLAGWTLVESGPFSPGNCVVESDTAGTVTPGFGAFTTPTPTDGAFVLMTDANLPGTCRFYQDVTVPAGVSAVTMSYAAGYNFALLGGPGGTPCSASVDVTNSSFTLIQNLWSATGGTNVALLQKAPVVIPVTPGSTIRVVLTAVSCNLGPAGIMADNLVLVAGSNQIPALDDRAKVILVLLILGSAILQLRQRA